MSKKINAFDIFELAKATGHTPSEVLSTIQQEGWEIVEDAQPTSTLQQQASVLNNPAGAVALMRKLREDTVKRLYKTDPLIRESLNAQMAIEASRAKPAANDIFIYDEQGNLAGVKHSVVSGIKATASNQTALMKEIQKNIYKKFGVNE